MKKILNSYTVPYPQSALRIPGDISCDYLSFYENSAAVTFALTLLTDVNLMSCVTNRTETSPLKDKMELGCLFENGLL